MYLLIFEIKNILEYPRKVGRIIYIGVKEKESYRRRMNRLVRKIRVGYYFGSLNQQRDEKICKDVLLAPLSLEKSITF